MIYKYTQDIDTVVLDYKTDNTIDTVFQVNNNDSISTTQDDLIRIKSSINKDAIENIIFQGQRRDSLISKKKIEYKGPKIIIPSNDSIIKARSIKEGIPYVLTSKQFKDLSQQNIFNNFSSDIKNLNKKFINPDLYIFNTREDLEQVNNYQHYISYPDQYKRIYKRIKTRATNDWLLGFLIISIIILGWSKLFFNKYLNQIIQAVYNFRLANTLFRDKNAFLKRLNILLNIIFIINVSVFMTQIMNYYSFNPFKIHTVYYLLFFLIVVPLIFFIKSIILTATGNLFLSTEIYREYIYNVYLINKNIGIYLLPIVLCILYINELIMPYFIIAGIGIIGYFYLIRIFRSIQIIFQKGVSKFYLFLYLCTLEILPVIWSVKIILLYV